MSEFATELICFFLQTIVARKGSRAAGRESKLSALFPTDFWALRVLHVAGLPMLLQWFNRCGRLLNKMHFNSFSIL